MGLSAPGWRREPVAATGSHQLRARQSSLYLFSEGWLSTCDTPSPAGGWRSGREQPVGAPSLGQASLSLLAPVTLAAFWRPGALSAPPSLQACHLVPLSLPATCPLELIALPLHLGILLPLAQETLSSFGCPWP